MRKIKPVPEKLTLARALNATGKPMVRLGDLLCVQVIPVCVQVNPDIFQSGEMRSIFAPNMDRKITEVFLRALYAAGGRIESAAEFSDEALTLLGDCWGDIGDHNQFVSDCKEALALVSPTKAGTMEFVRQMEIVQKIVLFMYKKYKLSSTQGEEYSQNQAGFRGRQQQLDIGKHDQWRAWQAEERADNPQFARQSKLEQARRLKTKYSIREEPGSIAKRLDPLPDEK